MLQPQVTVDIWYYTLFIVGMKFNIFERKKLKCDKCGEKFKNETELNTHQQITHERVNDNNKK
ncbi:MAG: C2H2-type zinc finger protein [Nitrososphaeraceae archaeon]